MALRPPWTRRTIATRDPSAGPSDPDGLRVTWLLIIGGFAAVAVLLLLWVAITTVRSVTEPVGVPAERDTVVAPPAPVVARPTLVSPAAPALPRIGQRVESAGILLAVSSVAKRSVHAGSVPAPGGTFLVVDVMLESRRRAAITYTASGFRLRAADGGEHVGLIPSSDDHLSLKGGALATGDVARGTVAFEVPAQADGFVLAFQPDDVVADYQAIRIALGD